MGILNFSNLDQAFILGSNQIKDTQEEIANLKKLINSTQIKKKEIKDLNEVKNLNEVKSSFQKISSNQSYPPETCNLMPYNYNPNTNPNANTNANVTAEDLNLLKAINHPKFDDIVKGYILMNHPEWINGLPQSRTKNSISYFGNNTLSYFGNKYSSSVCSDIKKYIIFFIVCIIIFLALSWSYKS